MNLDKYIGKKVKIKDWVVDEPNGQKLAGQEFLIEGYWSDINNGISWRDTDSNIAVYMYKNRITYSRFIIPRDDSVVYGKVGLYGHLLHITELELDDGSI